MPNGDFDIGAYGDIGGGEAPGGGLPGGAGDRARARGAGLLPRRRARLPGGSGDPAGP